MYIISLLHLNSGNGAASPAQRQREVW